MRAHQVFRFELDPGHRACSALASHAGAVRFAFNWGLATVTGQLGGPSGLGWPGAAPRGSG